MNRLLGTFVVVFAIGVIVVGTGGCDSSTSRSTSNSDSTTTLTTVWEKPYESAGEVRLPPSTIGDSLVLFGAEARLQAFDVDDGALVWESPSVSPSILEIKGYDLLAGDSTVYAAHVRNVHAWNLRDGSHRWVFERPSDTGLYELGFYALGPDHVFLFGNGGQILRVERTSGDRVDTWRYSKAIVGAQYQNGFLYLGQVWVPEGAEGQARGGLTKVDASSGDTLWTFTTRRGGFYDMRPIVEEGRVYAGTREGKGGFFAVDAETGKEIWRNEQAYTFAADHSGGSVYVNTSAELMGVSKETGRTLWKTDMPGGSGFGGVVYHDGYVYHPRGGALVVLDAEDGTIVHQEPSPSGYFWTIHAGAGRIFAQSSGHLVAYEPYRP